VVGLSLQRAFPLMALALPIFTLILQILRRLREKFECFRVSNSWETEADGRASVEKCSVFGRWLEILSKICNTNGLWLNSGMNRCSERMYTNQAIMCVGHS